MVYKPPGRRFYLNSATIIIPYMYAGLATQKYRIIWNHSHGRRFPRRSLSDKLWRRPAHPLKTSSCCPLLGRRLQARLSSLTCARLAGRVPVGAASAPRVSACERHSATAAGVSAPVPAARETRLPAFEGERVAPSTATCCLRRRRSKRGADACRANVRAGVSQELPRQP